MGCLLNGRNREELGPTGIEIRASRTGQLPLESASFTETQCATDKDKRQSRDVLADFPSYLCDTPNSEQYPKQWPHTIHGVCFLNQVLPFDDTVLCHSLCMRSTYITSLAYNSVTELLCLLQAHLDTDYTV